MENIPSEEKVKRLISANLNYIEDSGTWELHNEHGRFAFKSDEVALRRLLYRLEAKDSDVFPNSKRGLTYKQMIEKAKEKGIYKVFMWKSKHPQSIEEIRNLLN